LSAFNTISDPVGESQSAVFKFVDDSVTTAAVEALGSIILGNQRLTAQIVPPNMVHILLQSSTSESNEMEYAKQMETIVDSIDDKDTETLISHPPSTVLRFGKMTTDEDLNDEDLYSEMMEDVVTECKLHGNITKVKAPKEGLGRGLVFIHFSAIEGAVKCRAASEGRTFNGQDITVRYYPESLFLSDIFILPDNFSLNVATLTEDLD
jgi:hypothetical protein